MKCAILLTDRVADEQLVDAVRKRTRVEAVLERPTAAVESGSHISSLGWRYRRGRSLFVMVQTTEVSFCTVTTRLLTRAPTQLQPEATYPDGPLASERVYRPGITTAFVTAADPVTPTMRLGPLADNVQAVPDRGSTVIIDDALHERESRGWLVVVRDRADDRLAGRDHQYAAVVGRAHALPAGSGVPARPAGLGKGVGARNSPWRW